MRLGIVTPVVTLLPRAHGPVGARRRPRRDRHRRGGRRTGSATTTSPAASTSPCHATSPRYAARAYWDPLPTFGYLAARTSRIRLATHVLVLGYHHPLEIAKRYGTLDRVCGGRLILGVGVGSLREEFDLLGRALRRPRRARRRRVARAARLAVATGARV